LGCFLAIYHLTAKVISRGRGQSMVAAAAYRFGATLRDERYGVTHSYLGKRAVVHSEILAPEGSPVWVRDREALWNRVEAGERRKDSQLARLIELGLPVELTLEENVALVRDYIAAEFVSKGMIAEFCIRQDSKNPHSHILLTLRPATQSGFGPKERRWNGKSVLFQWRAAWSERANVHLARAGHTVRIDHRTLEMQQIELAPARKIGVPRARHADPTLPHHLSRRIAEQRALAKGNGEAILEDPTALLRALTSQRPIFTTQQLEEFLRPRTDGADQFDSVYRALLESNELVILDSAAEQRFTSRDMLEAEKSLLRRTTSMAARRGHAAAMPASEAAAIIFALDADQRRAVQHVLQEGDVKAVMAAAGCATDVLVEALRHAHNAAGLRPLTLPAAEVQWPQMLDSLTREAVLFVRGCELLGLKQLERIMAGVDRSRAKMVLIGDAERIGGGRVETPFQMVLRQVGVPHFE
jgi:MobA/MobL family